MVKTNTLLLIVLGLMVIGSLPVWRDPSNGTDGMSYWKYLKTIQSMSESDCEDRHIPYEEAVEKAREAWENIQLI